MDETAILFPHLHVALPHVGQAFYIGNFRIAYYGVIIAIGMALGSALILYLARKSGQNEELYVDLILVTVVCAILGARIYYVIFRWEDYRTNPMEIFQIRKGGLAIYGGVIAGILTIMLFARRKKKNVWLLLDTVCPGLVIGQIIGRWGNFFNREAFGDYTDGLLAMALPRSAVRQGEITDRMLEHSYVIDGIEFIQAHPTFLYESLWNLLLLFCLLHLWRYRKFDGQAALTYLAGYGLGRLWIEGLRTDQLLIPGTGIPISQMLSAVLIAGSIFCMAVRYRKKHGNPQEKKG